MDKKFEQLRERYERLLRYILDDLGTVIVFAVIIFISIGYLYETSKSELAPQEDQGVVLAQVITAPNSTLYQTEMYSDQVAKDFAGFPETAAVFQIDGFSGLNSSFLGMRLTAWDERSRTSNQLVPLVQNKLNEIAGAKIAVFQLPSLPGARGLPVQFVIQSTQSFDQIDAVSEAIEAKAYQSGMFLYVDSDLKIDKAQSSVLVDRNKASDMGLTMQDVSNALGAALSQGYINYFNYAGRAYQVIPQMGRAERLNASQILNYTLTAPDGTSVPLSTFAKLSTVVVPESLNHFQQLNSATISAVPFPGITLGQALDEMQNIAQTVLPQGYTIDYAGQSRQFKQEGSALVTTFIFALIIIFLSLSALFESFHDPLIVLISVPMSICGAMIFISLGIGGATLNIYTEVGLVTLIGLISKHGILIVQFANELQREGKSKREAVEMAAGIRLRPILMTTAAMVLGVVPLILATGAGAVSRFDIGLVIASGISIGTLFTLFVVPAMYLLLGQKHTV